MGRDVEYEIDVLKLVGEVVAHSLEQIVSHGLSGEFFQGQKDFFKRALRAIQSAPPDTTPADLLTRVGMDLDIPVTDAGLASPPADLRMTGRIAAWAFVLGVAEGTPRGGQAVATLLRDTPGVSSTRWQTE